MKYTEEIEKLIQEEIETQKIEDKDTEEFQNITDEQYRVYAIDNLTGNGVIK